MSPSHYYLISSLLPLRWGSRPPLSSADFLAQCEGQLAADDLADLRAVTLAPPEGREPRGAEARWHDWDGYVRNLIAGTRAALLRRDPADQLRPEREVFPSDRREIEEILTNDNPLERERALDHRRWRQLEELESGHPFDSDRLTVYRLKLLLLEKWAQFDAKNGERNLAGLVETGLQQAAEQRVASE
ncbi:MAG: DUF2764 family protein [Lentisphaeria bacterium]|jgi:hypothetical protein|nr:DUF2764 family protein [Lentisphaeria bacterium]